MGCWAKKSALRSGWINRLLFSAHAAICLDTQRPPGPAQSLKGTLDVQSAWEHTQQKHMPDTAEDATQLQEPATANFRASTVRAETMTAETTGARQEITTERDAANKTPTRAKVGITRDPS
jgi:hypothetical protein